MGDWDLQYSLCKCCVNRKLPKRLIRNTRLDGPLRTIQDAVHRDLLIVVFAPTVFPGLSLCALSMLWSSILWQEYLSSSSLLLALFLKYLDDVLSPDLSKNSFELSYLLTLNNFQYPIPTPVMSLFTH